MICGTCGSDNPNHLTFCQECGQRLAARVAPPTPPVGLPQPPLGAPPAPPKTSTHTVPIAMPPQPPPAPQHTAPIAQPRPAAPELKLSPRPSAPGAIADVVRCATCGATNQRGLRFCVACGQPVEAAPAASPAPAAVAPAPPPAPVAPAPPSFAIAPARVVDLGGPPAPKSAARICARCRGANDGTAQFCKFCGAALTDPTAPTAATRIATPPTTPALQAYPPSVAPATAQVDPAAYRAFVHQAHAAAPAASRPTEKPPAPPPPDPRASTGAMSAVTAPTTTRGRIVLIARDGGEGPQFPLADVTDIGRTEGNVLLGDDRYISPRHARILRRGDALFLRDLGSVNGIYLRIPAIGAASQVPQASAGDAGIPNENAVTLVDQDLFLVGQQVLRFEVVNDAEDGFGTASQHGTLLFGTPAAPRYARLSQRTVEGVTRDVFYIRKAETVLGRESGDIVFTEDPFLSRRHAVIRVDGAPRRFTLTDLGSSNGTFLQIREEVRLKDGDHFRVGQQLFRVDIDAGTASPAPPASPAASSQRN